MKKYRTDSEYHGMEESEDGEYYREDEVIAELHKKQDEIKALRKELREAVIVLKNCVASESVFKQRQEIVRKVYK